MKMIILIIFFMLIAIVSTPTDTNTIEDNKIEQPNIVQEEIETNNETEYMYAPVPNGKTVQIVSIPKTEKGE